MATIHLVSRVLKYFKIDKEYHVGYDKGFSNATDIIFQYPIYVRALDLEDIKYININECGVDFYDINDNKVLEYGYIGNEGDYKTEKEDGISFLHEPEKMVDFGVLTKQEFLNSYSYLTEADYDLTKKEYEKLI